MTSWALPLLLLALTVFGVLHAIEPHRTDRKDRP